ISLLPRLSRTDMLHSPLHKKIIWTIAIAEMPPSPMIRPVFHILIIVAVSVVCGCRQSAWESLTPKYSSEIAPQVYQVKNLFPDLTSIGTPDGKRFWIVGLHGIILQSDDQKYWRQQNSGTQNSLRSICGIKDGRQLWAVGEKGTILSSDDGGTRWQTQISGTSADLYSIICYPDKIWVVGDKGTILESNDGGKLWSSQASGSASRLE